jgi:hypothetical protein
MLAPFLSYHNRVCDRCKPKRKPPLKERVAAFKGGIKPTREGWFETSYRPVILPSQVHLSHDIPILTISIHRAMHPMIVMIQAIRSSVRYILLVRELRFEADIIIFGCGLNIFSTELDS